MTEQEANTIKTLFHTELQKYSYDIGGSLADLAEDALAAALRKAIESPQSKELAECLAYYDSYTENTSAMDQVELLDAIVAVLR